MAEEVLMKTHLIVTNIENNYHIKWVGKILDTNPQFKNNKFIFIVISEKGRIEINTTDMTRVEECAKKMTSPKGKTAFTSDAARIYIKEVDDNEKLLGILTHNRIKTFAPMFDKVLID